MKGYPVKLSGWETASPTVFCWYQCFVVGDILNVAAIVRVVKHSLPTTSISLSENIRVTVRRFVSFSLV